MRQIVAALTLAILVGNVAAPAAVRAGTSPRLTADLDGRPINPVDAGDYFCHDLDFPKLHCFSTGPALEAALRSLEQGSMSTAVESSVYVTVYSEPMYGGSYAHLAQNYDGLWIIGWNDRTSSFKVRNGASGRFYQDWNAGGWRYSFCCNSAVPGLSSTYDNQFSSVYRG